MGGAVTRRTDAIDLMTQLSQEGYERVVGGLGDDRTRRRVTRVRTSLELVPPELGRAISEGIAAYAEAATRRAAHDPDQMLRRLLREALFHAQRERRHSAAMLLSVSPYGPSVAAAVLELTTDADDLVASMCWSLLRRMGQVLDRGQVTRAAARETRTGLRARAFVTLGLTRGPLDLEGADLLLDTALSPATNGLRHASIFALGMAEHDHLDRLTSHDSATCRRAALWWRGIGSSLHDDDVP